MSPRGSSLVRLCLLVTLMTSCSVALVAQQATAASAPTVRFTKEQMAGPQRFVIEIDQAGNVQYQSWDTKESEDPYTLSFRASAETIRKIFEGARATNYFHGSFDFTGHPIADQGKKTLAYSDSTRSNSTTYNWSENATIQSLTETFESISSVLESGLRIETKRRFDPLGVDAELKIVEDAQQRGHAVELQAIAPVLLKVANDPQIMHIARERARKLLQASRAAAIEVGGLQGN